MQKTAFISDIHGNTVALNAVLEDIRDQGCTRVFVLGDIINGMEPSKCISILSGLENIAFIRGNAENYILTPDLDAFPRRDEGMYRELLHTLQWWHERMSQDDFAVIRSWPNILQSDGWYMVHDSPLDRAAVKRLDLGGIDQKYREILFHGAGIPENISLGALDEILAFMDNAGVSGLFVGHTHEPYIKHINGKMICNLGSVGFTLDGDPRPSWVLCQQDGTGQNFSIRRVAYDIDQAINRLMDVGYLAFTGEHQRSAYIKMLQTAVHWRFYV